MEKNEKENIFIVVMGPKGSGKTSFLEKLVNNASSKEISSTVEYKFYTLDYEEYTFNFIDTPSDGKYFDIVIRIAKDTDCLILIYDITQEFPKAYFDNILKRIKEERRKTINLNPITYFILLSKEDLVEKKMKMIKMSHDFVDFYARENENSYLGE